MLKKGEIHPLFKSFFLVLFFHTADLLSTQKHEFFHIFKVWKWVFWFNCWHLASGLLLSSASVWLAHAQLALWALCVLCCVWNYLKIVMLSVEQLPSFYLTPNGLHQITIWKMRGKIQMMFPVSAVMLLLVASTVCCEEWAKSRTTTKMHNQKDNPVADIQLCLTFLLQRLSSVGLMLFCDSCWEWQSHPVILQGLWPLFFAKFWSAIKKSLQQKIVTLNRNENNNDGWRNQLPSPSASSVSSGLGSPVPTFVNINHGHPAGMSGIQGAGMGMGLCGARMGMGLCSVGGHGYLNMMFGWQQLLGQFQG